MVQPATGSFSDWGLAAELAPMIGVWRQLLYMPVPRTWYSADLVLVAQRRPPAMA